MSVVEGAEALRRAGVWRRWLSTLVDGLIVGTPFQIIVACLFAVTAGSIQMQGGGFVFKACDRATIPAELSPAPPHDSNFATECSFSFLGLPTGRILYVGRTEKQGTTTKSVSREYMLNAAGEPVNSVSLDDFAFLGLVVYLAALTARRGRTFGDQAVRIRVIDTRHPSRASVPLRRVFFRYGAMMLGLLPFFAASIISSLTGGIEGLAAAPTMMWVGFAAAMVWALVLTAQIAMKRDPVYDWLAGTAVVLVDEWPLATEQVAPA